MTEKRSTNCHDCGVQEGEYHEPGCDMEVCPFCKGQLISCNCVYEQLGLFDQDKYTADTRYLPPDIYENGITDEQADEWEKLLKEKGFIPYIQYPIVCAKCGALWPEFFMVPNEEWQHYIEPGKQRDVICRGCYDFIKHVIDEAGHGMNSEGER